MTADTPPEPKRAAGDSAAGAGFKKLAIAAARLADAKLAEAVVVYDMAGRSPLADFVLVAAVDNPAQLEAVEEEISIKFKKEGLHPLYREGSQSKHWRVLDYGGLIVHVFERQARETFSFDKIYAGYAVVKWQAKAVPAPEKARPATAAGRAAPGRNKKRAVIKVSAKKAQAKKAPAKKAAAKKAPAKKKLYKKKKK
jgi:ribosome-associated protein